VQPQQAPGSCHYTYIGSDPLPDRSCTPGAVNPQVTQADIDSTICRSGYASSIRPPEDVTEPEKEASAAAYGYTKPFYNAEYDHLIPLEVGGDPNDPSNLWVEPPDNPNATSTSNTKDVLENRLNSLVCDGQITLATAQQAIATNWVTAYEKYVGTPPTYASAPTTTATGPTAGSPSPTNSASSAASCQATASPSNDGYSGDYEIYIHSNQPDREATASDAGDTWSHETDGSGYVDIRLFHTGPGESVTVTVGGASCSTTV
jgi:hypothetical protein